MILTILILSIAGLSFFYLRSMYSLFKFRRSIHQGDIVAYRSGYDIFVSEVCRIPGEDQVEIRDLLTSRITTVSIYHIFPL